MPFIEIPGVIGRVYTPDEEPAKKKKHDCPDCYACRFCCDERCELCLNRKLCGKCLNKEK